MGIVLAAAPARPPGPLLPADRSPGRLRSYRPDVQGLRGIAALAVVAGAAGTPGTPGGVAGMDVLFVLTGFLLTATAEAELRRAGRIPLGRRWRRQARRALPEAALVVAMTAVCAALLGPDPDRLTGTALRHLWPVLAAVPLVLLWPAVLAALPR